MSVDAFQKCISFIDILISITINGKWFIEISTIYFSPVVVEHFWPFIVIVTFLLSSCKILSFRRERQNGEKSFQHYKVLFVFCYSFCYFGKLINNNIKSCLHMVTIIKTHFQETKTDCVQYCATKYCRNKWVLFK